MISQDKRLRELCKSEWNRVKGDPNMRVRGFQSVPKRCMTCRKVCVNKPVVCEGCHSIFYCSTACRDANRQDRLLPFSDDFFPGHEKDCAKFKGYGEKFPAFKSLLDQFPWARYDEEGVFQEGIVRESRGVLGSGSEFGYWAICDPATCGCALDDVCSDNLIKLGALPDEKAGWKLPDEEIPWLKDARMKVPEFPATFEDSWKGYYEWRQLPLDSPAALLLQWPMSMFMCLRELGFVEGAPELDAPRRKLRVHSCNQDEMAVLPLFGELALLLPSTDLEITFISKEALMCARSALMEGIVDNLCPCAFEYTASGSLGAGTVRILLEGRTALYDPLNNPLFTNDPPDAIIALNAGLAAYPQWYSVYLGALTKQIPFAITEYCEQSLSTTHSAIRMAAQKYPGTDQSSAWYKDMVAMRPEWKMNPFMCPGMMLDKIPTASLPYAQNAFVYVVTPGRRD